MTADKFPINPLSEVGCVEGCPGRRAGRQSEAIRLALLDARLQGIVNKHNFAADAAANKQRLGRPQQ